MQACACAKPFQQFWMLDKLRTSQSIRCNCGWIQIISTMLSLVYSWALPHQWICIAARPYTSKQTFKPYVCVLDASKRLTICLFHHASNNKSIWMTNKMLCNSHNIHLSITQSICEFPDRISPIHTFWVKFTLPCSFEVL